MATVRSSPSDGDVRGSRRGTLAESSLLAAVQREAAALKRENEALRARLCAITDTAAVTVGQPDAERLRPVPGGPIRCRRCGFTLHHAAIQDDRGLVFASCCPRCDGPLNPPASPDATSPLASDPSIYLG